jgi:hypothetical protein
MSQNNWRLMFKFLLKTSVFCVAARESVGFADALRSEATFRSVFVNAGYSAAFGAAAGAAMLPFFPEPALSNLRYVAAGASIGFVVGSAVAFYRLSQNNSIYTNTLRPNEGVFEGDDAPELYSQDDTGFETSFVEPADAHEPSIYDGALFAGGKRKLILGIPNITLVPKNESFSNGISYASIPVVSWKF